MANKTSYLRPNVQVEPLVNQWYAWSYLMAPATAAMSIADSHVKIMESYVINPEAHIEAMKIPALRGGPFIAFEECRVDEIRSLLQDTFQKQAHLIAFADAVKRLNRLLMTEARGHSLEGLYQQVPDLLKGYVELVYDLNNQPAMRFVEGLLYKSPYYNPSIQSLRLSLIHSDQRSFIFSTPRLPDAQSLHLKTPFNNGHLDELFRMKETPGSVQHLMEVLGVEKKEHDLFSSYFTDEAPPSQARYDGEAVRVRYLGHACLLIESKTVSVLTDPVISYSYESEIPRYKYSDLPETIDYVVITHSHADHTLLESLLQLRHKVRTLIVPRGGGGFLQDPSLKLMLRHLGFEDVRELDELETIAFDGGSITGLPFWGEHADLSIRSKIAHLIRLGDQSILCAADSCNVEPRLYERLHQIVGDVDVLFLGMECDGAPLSWVYGHLLSVPLERRMDQSRRLNGSDFKRAIEMVNCLHCRQVYVYAMGQEPWLGYITSIVYTKESRPIIESNRLIETCRSRGLRAERLFGRHEFFLK